MAGHSKWSNIKHKKGKADAARGKIFTKIGREIAMAVKEGGPDPNSNGKLRDIIVKARANNMPNDNITRSIKKASGELGDVIYEEIVYEGYGPGGVAFILDAITDNRNRTAGDVRSYFSKCNGSLGTSGSVAYMFDKKGVIIVEKDENIQEDDFMLIALECGAEDIIVYDEEFEVHTQANDVTKVNELLIENGINTISSEIEMFPQNYVDINDEDILKNTYKLIELLEDCDDVQKVWHNANLPDEDEEE
ncbi:MAG: YebC/PmpR family DNA-binding transcriptional regulator [Christensenellaceae bacterium]|nr:YebC/PmpR family DNA-binding transcriptional regulator [Christensenellaceae bacterium]